MSNLHLSQGIDKYDILLKCRLSNVIVRSILCRFDIMTTFNFAHNLWIAFVATNLISFTTARSTPPCGDYLQCVLKHKVVRSSIRMRSTLLSSDYLHVFKAKWRHKTYDIIIMRPTPLVPTFMMFFQILVNFIAFVIGCDYSVTCSIRRGIQGISGDYATYYAMKIIMQNTCIFWWLPSMSTQLMRCKRSKELNFMHNWEVYATSW